MALPLLIFGLLAFLPHQDGGAPRILCKLSRNTIYSGEKVLYRVRVENLSDAPEPDLSGFTDFEVTPEGDQSLDSVQMSLINGKVSRVETHGHEFTYWLRTDREGEVLVPAPKIVVDGKVLKGQQLILDVVPPENQDLAVLELAADHDSVYPMQSFTLVLQILVKSLPDEWGLQNKDPVDVLRNPPALEIPWTEVPEGLESVSLDEWLGGLVDRPGGGGFTINNLTRRSGILFEQRAILFQLPADWANHDLSSGGTAAYRRYRLVRTFIPHKEGVFHFGPASLKGTLISGIRGQRPLFKGVYTLSGTVDVKVKPVPIEGRPLSYTGGIGHFETEARLTPEEVNVGDPMTLTFTVSGSGTLEDVGPPDLEKVKGVFGAFKVYDATAEFHPKLDKKVFTYSLRSIKPGLDAFPALPFSFFNVEKDSYETVWTEPIPITVHASRPIEEDAIVSAPPSPPPAVLVSPPGSGPGSPPPGSEAPSGRPGVSRRLPPVPVSAAIPAPRPAIALSGYFANEEDLDSLVDFAPDTGQLGIWLAGLFSTWLAAAFFAGRVRRLRADPVLRRRKEAPHLAAKRLRLAERKLRSASPNGGAELLAEAITGLFADACGRNQAGLTPGDLERLAKESGCDSELAGEMRQLLELCDAARFGSGLENPDSLARKGRQILLACHRALRKTGRLR
ncbi:MAG: BatD family protein [Planctomycetota bacterium]